MKYFYNEVTMLQEFHNFVFSSKLQNKHFFTHKLYECTVFYCTCTRTEGFDDHIRNNIIEYTAVEKCSYGAFKCSILRKKIDVENLVTLSL